MAAAHVDFGHASASTLEFADAFRGFATWARLVECHDGDTCKLVFAPNVAFPSDMFKFTSRLFGIDASKMGSSLPALRARAVRARNRLLQLSGVPLADLDRAMTRTNVIAELAVTPRVVFVLCHEMDKYGRLLVEVSAAPGQRTFNQVLLDEGLAYAYTGDAKMGEASQLALGS